MSNASEIAAGLRAYADFVEQHPEIPAEADFTVYGVRTHEQVHALLKALGSPVIRVVQDHTICYVHGGFPAISIEYIVKRDVMAMPTIEGNKVVWVLKPEFAAGTEEASLDTQAVA